MENLPFCEELKGGWYYRTFESNLTEEDLKWHYDEEDRLMVVLHDTNWMFQYDNQLPSKLEMYNTYVIPKGNYHRLIKGDGVLKLKILKVKHPDEKINNRISKSLQYHLDKNLNITNSIYRIGSDSWCDLINEVRDLYFEGNIELSDEDKDIILTDAGKKGIFENEIVPLDAPFPVNDEEYAVFVKENETVKKILFK